MKVYFNKSDLVGLEVDDEAVLVLATTPYDAKRYLKGRRKLALSRQKVIKGLEEMNREIHKISKKQSQKAK